MTALRTDGQVFWWKWITRHIEYPHRAEVVTVGPKRVTILVQDPDDAEDRYIRHVAVDRLQSVAGYHKKVVAQGPHIWEPTMSCGRFTRHLEVGKDLRAVRHVAAFENGSTLCYDRVHWVDDFGMLGDARMSRNRNEGVRCRCQRRTGQMEQVLRERGVHD